MKRLLSAVVICLLVVSLASAHSPANRAHGLSLSELLDLYWSWVLGASDEDHYKNVVFLPIPPGAPSEDDPSILVGEADFSLHSGESFLLPVFTYVGETYLEEGIPDDNPDDLPAEVFTGATILVMLDGKVIIDNENAEDYFADTRFFDAPIFYDEPVEYADDVHAIGAIWQKGIAFVQKPLKKGEHTLELFVFSPLFGIGFANTWHLTVEK